MDPRERRLWAHLTGLVFEALVLAGLWLLAVLFRSHWNAVWPFDWLPSVVVFAEVDAWRSLPYGLVVVPTWVAVRAVWPVSDPDRNSWRRALGAGALATLVSLAGWTLFRADPMSRTLLLGYGLVACPVFVAGDWVRRLRRRGGGTARIVAIGPSEQVDDAVTRWGGDFGGTPQVLVRLDAEDPSLASWVASDGVDHVLVTGVRDVAGVVAVADEVGVPVILDANFGALPTDRVWAERRNGLVVLRIGAATLGASLVAKRLVDIVGATVLLCLSAPILAGAAVAIRLGDGGPVLFQQTRMGKSGRPFVLYKLRTMGADAEDFRSALQPRNEADGPVFKLRDDPRVTKVGRWLRHSSIDELPQLVNVLRGEMSLVGPRPPLPEEVARYLRPWRRRLSMRPGITGPWQVAGRSDLDFATWMRLDLEYVDRWNLCTDAMLLVRTVPAVWRGAGAR